MGTPRAMWTGSISFGLVMIPVKMSAATESHDVNFNKVRKSDGSRIRYKQVAQVDDQPVAYEDITKGYELPNGEMVVLSNEDIADMEALIASTKEIKVSEFVDAESLADPLVAAGQKSYYLYPDTKRGGGKAYSLLTQALRQTEKVALATITLRNRETVVGVRARTDGVLLLTMLNWADEIRAAVVPDTFELEPEELKMAVALVEALATPTFDLSHFTDGYTAALQEIVARKTGDAIKPPEGATVTDISQGSDVRAMLEASLAARAAENESSVAEQVAAEIDPNPVKPKRTRKTAAK